MCRLVDWSPFLSALIIANPGGAGVVGRCKRGYEVSKIGTKGVPLNSRARASAAPTAFLRAVEM